MGNNLSSQMESGKIMNSTDKIKLWDLRNKNIEAVDETERPSLKARKGVSFDLIESTTASLIRNSSSNDASCEAEKDSSSASSNSVDVVMDDRILESEFKRYRAHTFQRVNANALDGFGNPFTSCAPPVRESVAESGICTRCYLPRIDCLCSPHSAGCPKFAFRTRIGVSGKCPNCLFNPGCSGCNFCQTCLGYDGCVWCSGCDWCRYCSNYIGCKYYTKCAWCNLSVGCSWCKYCVGRMAYDHDNPKYWERGFGWVRYIDV